MEESFWRVWRNPYLLQHIYSQLRGTDANEAARVGNLQAFKYSVLQGYSQTTMDIASARGHLEVIQWLHDNREEGCTSRALSLAAGRGHLKTVQWLKEHRSDSWSMDTVDWAVTKGHFDMVKWLYANRNVSS